MRVIRQCVPILGIVALAVLFFKLPETPNPFNIFKCATCHSNDPYFTLIATAYFALLVALSLVFPAFPSSKIAQAGLVWSILLACSLTYLNLPNWCVACLISHVCHILIWTVWWLVPVEKSAEKERPISERLCLTLFVPISVVALFSCLNLTFMAYGFKAKQNLMVSTLQAGDDLPEFELKTDSGQILNSQKLPTSKMVAFNFVSPDCPYCNEQLTLLKGLLQKGDHSIQFVNITPLLTPEMRDYSVAFEWLEDPESQLRKLFKVSGYPTMFIVENNKISHVVSGVPEQLNAYLLTLFAKQEKTSD